MRIAAALQEQFFSWALRGKPPEASPVTLGQRRVYVLPTRAGIGYAAVLLTMLLGSINYNLSLGYVLTFLLAALGVVAILHTFRNLVRLKVSRGRTPPAFAGEAAAFHLVLAGDSERRALRLWLPEGGTTTIDVPARDSADACLRLPTTKRGWLALPRVGIETTWPLGLIRAWAYCAPDMRCLVYPKPAAKAPPLPWGAGEHGGRRAGGQGSDDFSGLRDHHPADPPRHVAWKIAARQGDEAPLLTKQFDGAAASRIWLDWEATPGEDVETRLSVLTRWALDAHAAGLEWGLRLPERSLAPASGGEHLHAALSVLALHGQG
ncbi:MAG: DUF58 domain-containing protein [Gammaproteobacteria bacterium]|nr:DUF58 domain-containing protein [Gammaproteobacteria bacterium]MBU1416709.1 DUF58 domain-containing protein [Gammaproteobacteria bacterium]